MEQTLFESVIATWRLMTFIVLPKNISLDSNMNQSPLVNTLLRGVPAAGWMTLSSSLYYIWNSGIFPFVGSYLGWESTYV